MKIRCSTLFDITKTGIGRRQSATKDASIIENKSRNQQINFETILQIISMRCQPENISNPQKNVVEKDSRWGSEYSKDKLCVWQFTFTTYHRDVFYDGIDKLGNLYKDSDGVPMITNLDESPTFLSKININGDHKNIHYEIVEDDSDN